MFVEKLFTSNRGAFKDNIQDVQSKYGAFQMKIFMDYCFFIEKLWLDWKQYYYFFTLNGAEMMRRDIPKIINLMYC